MPVKTQRGGLCPRDGKCIGYKLEQQVASDSSITDTERSAIVRARVGQGYSGNESARSSRVVMSLESKTRCT